MKSVMVYLSVGIGNQISFFIKLIVMLSVVEQEVIIKFPTVWDVSECCTCCAAWKLKNHWKSLRNLFIKMLMMMILKSS